MPTPSSAVSAWSHVRQRALQSDTCAVGMHHARRTAVPAASAPPAAERSSSDSSGGSSCSGAGDAGAEQAPSVDACAVESAAVCTCAVGSDTAASAPPQRGAAVAAAAAAAAAVMLRAASASWLWRRFAELVAAAAGRPRHGQRPFCARVEVRRVQRSFAFVPLALLAHSAASSSIVVRQPQQQQPQQRRRQGACLPHQRGVSVVACAPRALAVCTCAVGHASRARPQQRPRHQRFWHRRQRGVACGRWRALESTRRWCWQ